MKTTDEKRLHSLKRIFKHSGPSAVCAALILGLFIVLSGLVASAVAAPPVKSIRVVMDDNYPPYVFKDEQGGLKGIIVDQWRLWEQKTGIRAELSGMDWGEAQKRMQAGEFDVIDTIFKTEKREAYLDFTRPYAKIDFSIFLHNDISGIRDAKDLKGFLVGVKSGGAVIDILKKYGVENIAVYPRDLSIVEAARDSKIKVFVMGDQSALYFLNKLQIAHDYRHSADVFSAEFHRAVPKGRSDLLAILDKGFSGISPEEYGAIEKEWTGTSLGNTALLRYFRHAAGAVSAVVAIIVVWLMLLRRAVKRTTRELAASEEKYRTIIDNMQDVFYRADAEGRLTMMSPSGPAMLGYDSVDQMLGLVIRESFYYDPIERDAFVHNLKMKGNLDGYEVTLKRKDGRPVPVATSTHLVYDSDGAFIGVEGVFRDITESRQSAELLRESEARFSSIMELSPDIISIINMDGTLRYNSPAAFHVHGYSPEEILGLNTFELIHPDDQDKVKAAFSEILSNAKKIVSVQYRYKNKDGSYVWMECSANNQFSNPHLNGIIAISRNISERKRNEELLKKSEENYRLLVEQSAAWIWKTDAALRHTYSNDNVERMLGYSVQEFCAMDIMKLVHPDDLEALRKVTEAATIGQGWRGLVLRWRSRNGSWRLIESSGMPVFDEEGNFEGLQGVDMDITDRHQLEQEREKGQRLESLGLLAGGIAHDFNNILTGIVGNLSLARRMIDCDQRVTGRLEECENAAMRASELTRQLLTFARGGEPVKRAVNTSRLIQESLSFGLRGSNVNGVLELVDDLWAIDADEGQINQVFNNLLINATQAMPNGGTVTVSAENRTCNITSERSVRISVRDTGVGIPGETLSKIFDPYFTTKAGGTGLGLASVYSIVTRHGGTVTASSEPGCGTEFVICLPTAADSAPQDQGVVAGSSVVCIAKRVLVMDDEEVIREVVSMMLNEIGCAVDTSCDGAAAIELYRTARDQGKAYDAVILDLTVPGGMGGLEASRLIRAIDPEAVLMVSSGYSQDAVMADYLEYGFCGSVMKPYSFEALSGELNRVMAARGERRIMP
jgi:PAS domain S-box-containing protein